MKDSARTVPTCRYCGCAEADCSICIKKTGKPCYWVAPDVQKSVLPKIGGY